MLDSNTNGYFFDNSLFFPDREAILVFGGVDPHEEYGRAGNTGKDMYRFKPDENIWEFVGEIPQARHHHSIAYLRGRIYVVGESSSGGTSIKSHFFISISNERYIYEVHLSSALYPTRGSRRINFIRPFLRTGVKEDSLQRKICISRGDFKF